MEGTARERESVVTSQTLVERYTFGTGEHVVILKNGRMRIQCVEINMATGTVLLQIGSERRELRLGQK